LPDAKQLVKTSLGNRVREKIASFEKQSDRVGHNEILNMLRECSEPILISSRAQDMSAKSFEEYSPEEKEDFSYWKDFISEEKMQEEFASIGNFQEIRQVYDEVKTEKMRLLEEKQREFIPKVYMELKGYLQEEKKQTEIRMDYLQNNDRKSLEEQQSFFESKINGIKADVVEVFGNTLADLKKKKSEVNNTLREMSVDAAKLETHVGTEYHTGSYTSYAFELGPIHLGGHTESYSYTTTYQYLAASDALEQINAYGKGAASKIEAMFTEIVELKAYRRKLLEAVIHNLDSSEEGFDANYFRIVVQNALNTIDFPEVHINVSRELEEIGNAFSGEVRNSADQEKFRRLLSDTVEKMYQSLGNKVDKTISDFLKRMQEIQESLCDDILDKVNQEFANIKEAINEKKTEIAKGGEYIKILEQLMLQL
jgi:hypothetical protein